MNSSIKATRLTVCIAVAAATLGGVLVSPANADDHGRDRSRGHERHDNYRQGPDVYESAPPIVVVPQGYYAQPGATLSFGLPFYR